MASFSSPEYNTAKARAKLALQGMDVSEMQACFDQLSGYVSIANQNANPDEADHLLEIRSDLASRVYQINSGSVKDNKEPTNGATVDLYRAWPIAKYVPVS